MNDNGQDMFSRIALFSFGFRPFFFAGAVWAASAMALWIAFMTGRLDIAEAYGPFAWHAHEFLFGYGAAIVAGFLMTAIPNWTGRLPIRGNALFALFIIWLAGRIALLITDTIGLYAGAAADSLFLLCFTALVFREIIAGQDRRNLKVAIILLIFCTANIGFHAEVITTGAPFYAIRAAVSVFVLLIMLIGGRIVPSFTRNWLMKRQSERLPATFNAYDRWSLLGAVVSLALWICLPYLAVTGYALLFAAFLQAGRMARWMGLRTVAEPLVLILHIGYLFIPLGFATVAGSVLWPGIIPSTAALHAWTAGGIGVMTLAVMTRASRGHSGRPLTAPPSTQLIYLLVIAAALLRMATILLPQQMTMLLILAAGAWITAFTAFALVYGPMLLLRRPPAAKS